MCQRLNTGESYNFYFGIFICIGPLSRQLFPGYFMHSMYFLKVRSFTRSKKNGSPCKDIWCPSCTAHQICYRKWESMSRVLGFVTYFRGGSKVGLDVC